MKNSSGKSEPAVDEGAGFNSQQSEAHRLGLVKWHIERYDRLRASTASRAGVLTSASALLSAGNAVVISQIGSWLDEDPPGVFVVIFAVLILASVLMVVISLTHAAGVLVTSRGSREYFGDQENVPTSLVFNGTDTVANLKSFSEFADVVGSQSDVDVFNAALAELWIIIRQHRIRYSRLRRSVRFLTWAAANFVVVSLILVVSLVVMH